jgi:hypothetical protein
MDEGAIIVCNLSKGRLGEGVARLLGALLTTAIAQAALSRADVPPANRPVFHLYADEFQSFAAESFALSGGLAAPAKLGTARIKSLVGRHWPPVVRFARSRCSAYGCGKA